MRIGGPPDPEPEDFCHGFDQIGIWRQGRCWCAPPRQGGPPFRRLRRIAFMNSDYSLMRVLASNRLDPHGLNYYLSTSSIAMGRTAASISEGDG